MIMSLTAASSSQVTGHLSPFRSPCRTTTRGFGPEHRGDDDGIPVETAPHTAAAAHTWAKDNTERQCARCQRSLRDKLIAPPEAPAKFWQTEQFRQAFVAQHIGWHQPMNEDDDSWLRCTLAHSLHEESEHFQHMVVASRIGQDLYREWRDYLASV